MSTSTLRRFLLTVALLALLLPFASCSTAPKAADQPTFTANANTATRWFERNVPGLREQIDNSAGYVIFPEVGQYGILIGGGTFGRGSLNRPNGSQIGWAALNTGSVGLQAGVQGFKMLMVLEDQATLDRFMANQLTGSVQGVALVGEGGAGTKASFTNGVAIYQGARTGLMAGASIALDVVRYQPR